MAVHPRACGEHLLTNLPPVALTGSSPRMRGTPFPRVRPAVPGRFIPAHAGNTSRSVSVIPAASVHPRACGEHNGHGLREAEKGGSSPRMRGTRTRRNRQYSHHRFIPAHAGNTARQRFRGSQPAVHPRACGEHCVSVATHDVTSGSSPRMRGTHKRLHGFDVTLRFIPAHAGNTIQNVTLHVESTVHPRACGEHSRAYWNSGTISGSSPRMRGTPASHKFGAAVDGSSPRMRGTQRRGS